MFVVYQMQLNIGITMLLLCLAYSMLQSLGAFCPSNPKSTFGKMCRFVIGWSGCIVCLLSCGLLIAGPFMSSMSL